MTATRTDHTMIVDLRDGDTDEMILAGVALDTIIAREDGDEYDFARQDITDHGVYYVGGGAAKAFKIVPHHT